MGRVTEPQVLQNCQTQFHLVCSCLSVPAGGVTRMQKLRTPPSSPCSLVGARGYQSVLLSKPVREGQTIAFHAFHAAPVADRASD